MTIEDFDKKYKKSGGIEKLMMMFGDHDTLKVISEQFGVTRESVKLWALEFVGKKYDPRKARRKERVKVIKQFIELYDEEKARKRFKNPSYIEEALKNDD